MCFVADYYDITRTPRKLHDGQPVHPKMGAYLSEPITKKVSSDEVGRSVAYGASSMQGWRISQEVSGKSCLSRRGRGRSRQRALPRRAPLSRIPQVRNGSADTPASRLVRSTVPARVNVDAPLPTPRVRNAFARTRRSSRGATTPEVRFRAGNATCLYDALRLSRPRLPRVAVRVSFTDGRDARGDFREMLVSIIAQLSH